jgi:glycosyltransferase involved in cell wall biosynthesis
MRISVIGPVYPYRGGIAHFTAQLLRVVSDHGHSVQTISFKRQYPGWLYPGASDKDPSPPSLPVAAEYLLDPFYPWTWQRAIQRILQHRPELVIIQWWTTFWAPAYLWLGIALRKKGLKVVFLIHNVLPHEQRVFDPVLARLALRTGSAFITQTEREKERLLNLLPGCSAVVCPHPGYFLLQEQKISRQEARHRLGYPLDHYLLLFFGIIRPYKGLRYLIEALAIMKNSNLQPNLLVAGEVWEGKEEYLALIRELGLEEQIRLEDRYVPDEEAAMMFSAADLLVVPYVEGTQSAVAGMGLGFGLPMVVTEVVAGGIAAENQANLRVVPMADAAALADAIRQALLNPPPLSQSQSQVDQDWERWVKTLESFCE